MNKPLETKTIRSKEWNLKKKQEKKKIFCKTVSKFRTGSRCSLSFKKRDKLDKDATTGEPLKINKARKFEMYEKEKGEEEKYYLKECQTLTWDCRRVT